MRLLELLAQLTRDHDATVVITIAQGRPVVSWKAPGRRAERVRADASPSELVFALIKRLLVFGDVTEEELLREVTRG